MPLEFVTDRLSFRPLAEDDLDLGLDLFTDEAVTRFVCAVQTPGQIEKSMADSIRRGGDGCIGVWCVRRLDDGEKLGSAVLLPLPIESDDTDWSLVVPGRMPDGEIELGYLLKPSAWGRGYATEIGHRLLRFAFEETPLDEVVAVTDLANHASRRVLRKIGMREEGTRRAYATECTAFRLGRDEWLARQAAGPGAGGTRLRRCTP